MDYVEVQRNLDAEEPVAATRVFLHDRSSGRGFFVYATVRRVRVHRREARPLRQLLEVWSEEPGPNGQASGHTFYVADIDADDKTVVTMELAEECWSSCVRPKARALWSVRTPGASAWS